MLHAYVVCRLLPARGGLLPGRLLPLEVAVDVRAVQLLLLLTLPRLLALLLTLLAR